ncbi:MAG: four helix bundle protein [Candidatus Bipolaricaulota bacterium]|nr:four helix bundle protein [Candidatus Bipolaricaulota bacterium]
MALAKAVYAFTQAFPREEMYGLTAQLRRAAISVPCNIAEGAARGSKKEFAQFLFVAFPFGSGGACVARARCGSLRRPADFGKSRTAAKDARRSCEERAG